MAISLDQLISEGLPRHVSREVYTDQGIFERERVQLFARTWHAVCLANEVPSPGDYVTTTVADLAVVVLRDKDGGIRAFQNSCAHRGAALAPDRQGNCGGLLKCMYHGWSFDLTGQCIGVPYPAAYGEDFDKNDFPLRRLHVDEFAGLVFVAIDPLVPSLVDYLSESGPYLEQMCGGREVIGRVSFLIEGNWKLWHDNFADNYHPEFSHRIVHDLFGGVLGNGGNEQLDFGHGLLRFFGARPDFDRYAEALKRHSGWTVDPRQNPQWGMSPIEVGPDQHDMILTIFPDFNAINIRELVTWQRVHPLGVSRARVETVILGRIGESEEIRNYRLRSAAYGEGTWGNVTADDAESFARTQIGITAGGLPFNIARGTAPGKIGERYDEYSLRSFHAAWDFYMEAK